MILWILFALLLLWWSERLGTPSRIVTVGVGVGLLLYFLALLGVFGARVDL